MKRTYLFLSVIMVYGLQPSHAQETYLPLGSEEYHLLNRIETRSGILSDQLFLNTQPVSRASAADFLNQEKSNAYENTLTNVDHFNINRALTISSEWAPATSTSWNSTSWSSDRRVNGLYPNPANFLQWDKNGLFIAANPILGFQGIYEKDNPKQFLINTTQGAEIRAKIYDYAGIYFSLTHNYEEPVSYVREWIISGQAIPGAGPYSPSGNGYSYLLARGYVNAPLIKDHISLSLGYDRHFIGDGYRSLFLSDFSEGAAFARLNTRIWKLNYQNLYLMLQPQSFRGETPSIGHKYATVHYLSANVTRWLNLGLFESVTFARNGHFEFGYLNPVIFYRAVERSMGSPDKVSIGLNAKAIVARHVSFYTQVLINEFTSKELLAGNGYWANKWGIQAGAKYYDAFTISNLDVQAEVNIIRPYTFQHTQRNEGVSPSNYTHYNQPLAHPLGAGFAELSGLLRYQPAKRLTFNAKVTYYQQGVDTGNANLGNNIFDDYQTRSQDYGVKLINGPQADCKIATLNIAYEFLPRLYLDLGGTYRSFTVAAPLLPDAHSLYVYSGLRVNLNRKDYTQY